MRFNLVVLNPDALFNVIDQRRRDQAVIEANEAARRQTATRRNARTVAAAGTKLHGSTADEHDGSQSAKTGGVNEERNRRYENNERLACGKLGHKQGDCPQSEQSTAGKAFMARAMASPLSSSSSSSNQQAVPLSVPGVMPPGRPLRLPPLGAGASGYKTASKVVVTRTEHAAPAASTQKDDDYVHIGVPQENVVPVDTRRTQTVQHHVFQRAGPQYAAPVLQSVPVQLPAPASQQWLGYSGTLSFARVLVVQPGGSGGTSVDTVDTEPRL